MMNASGSLIKKCVQESECSILPAPIFAEGRLVLRIEDDQRVKAACRRAVQIGKLQFLHEKKKHLSC